MNNQAPTATLDRARADIARLLGSRGCDINPGEIRVVESGIEADLAVPLFRSAKTAGRNPAELAEELAGALDPAGTMLAGGAAARGYLNFTLRRPEFVRSVVADYTRDPAAYGGSGRGRGKTVVIDYSSPNIAKPFSVGHLRSTIIGQALHNILAALGYRPVGDNHLGDWGTQFGKLLCAYDRWGDEAELARTSTGHLLQLYVRFHEEATKDPSLEQQARDWFRRLETGDTATRRTWQRFVELSSAEFARVYELLGVEIDNTLGESFYADRLDEVVERALAQGIARREVPPEAGSGEETPASGEAVVLIPLDAAGIETPLILQKSDGTSLYATREIATAEYRLEQWHPDKLLYVVGNEQQLYFRQLAAALRLLGHETPVVHVNFGLIRLPEGRMSTREGRVVLLEDVIREAVRRARAVVEDRDLPDDEKDRIARVVGIGALKYADLSQSRNKEVVFDWDKMLALDGNSAPYLQYAHTRCRSILARATERPEPDLALLAGEEEFALTRQLARFPDAVAAAGASYEPHRIANYLYRLAQDFSGFYNRTPVLKADSPGLVGARLLLVEMTGTVLRNGLGLLGINVPERM